MSTPNDPFAPGPIHYIGNAPDPDDLTVPTDDGAGVWNDELWADEAPVARPAPRTDRPAPTPETPAEKPQKKAKTRGRGRKAADDAPPIKRAPAKRKPAATRPQPATTSGSTVGGLASLLRGHGKERSSSQVTHLTPTIGRKIGGSAVLAVVGNGGRTTTAVGLGHILAAERPGRVIVVDATAEGGDLCDLVVREQGATVDDLLKNLDTITEYRHIREFTCLSPSGLEFLVSDPNNIDVPDVTGEDLACLLSVLRPHYDIIILDTAAGIRDDLHTEALRQADHLVMVSSGASGMRRGIWTINQLTSTSGHYEGQYHSLVDGMTVIVNDIFPNSSVDATAVADAFIPIAHETVIAPFDPAVEGGAPFDPDAVTGPLRDAWTRASAALIATIAAERNPR